MIFEMAGGLVSGGWNALANITSGIGTGISRIGSTFFPGPQRQEPIKSEIMQAGTYTSLPYPAAPEAQSIWESITWANQNWSGSPYAQQYGPTIKALESLKLAEQVSATPTEMQPSLFDNIIGGLDWAATQSRNIRTIVDEISGPWAPRETVYGTPQAGYPEGRDERHLNDNAQTGANVWEITKAYGQNIIDQVKGLFNMGFPQQGGQPAFGITHEVSPSKGLTVGLIVAGVVIVLVILLGRKK